MLTVSVLIVSLMLAVETAMLQMDLTLLVAAFWQSRPNWTPVMASNYHKRHGLGLKSPFT